jgi:sulfite reductase alpha subunit-like flavoprotein
LAAYQKWVSSVNPNIVDVLEDFLSVDVDAAALISTLPMIQPRFYSISSSAAFAPTEIQFRNYYNFFKFKKYIEIIINNIF